MSTRPDLIYLTEAELRQTLSMSEAIVLAEKGIEADASGKVTGDKFYMSVGDDGFLKTFSGHMVGEDLAFVKVFSFFEENADRDLPVTESQVLLYDATTGLPVAMMEADWITGLKTGASTAATAKRLAPAHSGVATIFGAGRLGRHHGTALDLTFHLDELRIVDAIPEAAHRYAADMAPTLRAPVRVVESAGEAVDGADIVVTVTTGDAVNVEPGWVKPGALVARLGSYREVDEELFETARLVVDRWTYVSSRVPEMKSLIAAGRLHESDAVSWPEVVAGRATGRRAADEIILYVALGIWGEYAAILPEAYRRARSAGLGRVIAGGESHRVGG